MIAFMTKTLSSINEDLKAGKTVVITVQSSNETQGDAAGTDETLVDAVTTATFENYRHRIPAPFPPMQKKIE